MVLAVDPDSCKKDQQTLVRAFGVLSIAAMSRLDVHLGMKVTAKVQLVKDYGLILSVDGFSNDLTGFIANE